MSGIDAEFLQGIVNMYSQHRRSFLLACHHQRSCLCQTGRFAASPFRWFRFGDAEILGDLAQGASLAGDRT